VSIEGCSAAGLLDPGIGGLVGYLVGSQASSANIAAAIIAIATPWPSLFA
jgi:hypothetical protein